ncbi:11298_t:CDS:1, partial [Gigaspora rosea]
KFPNAAPYLNRALFNEKERWALCYTSKIFTAGMQSIEGQNAIIKTSVNSSTSLTNLVKYIDEQIDRASTFIQYKNWVHTITGSTLTHASSEFSPEIDEWITSYLTPAFLSMQRQGIFQAIWYTSRLINDLKDLELQSNSTELSNLTESFDLTEQFDSIEQSDSTEAFDMFIEDTIDALAILLSKLIPFTKVESI